MQILNVHAYSCYIQHPLITHSRPDHRLFNDEYKLCHPSLSNSLYPLNNLSLGRSCIPQHLLLVLTSMLCNPMCTLSNIVVTVTVTVIVLTTLLAFTSSSGALRKGNLFQPCRSSSGHQFCKNMNSKIKKVKFTAILVIWLKSQSYDKNWSYDKKRFKLNFLYFNVYWCPGGDRYGWNMLSILKASL